MNRTSVTALLSILIFCIPAASAIDDVSAKKIRQCRVKLLTPPPSEEEVKAKALEEANSYRQVVSTKTFRQNLEYLAAKNGYDPVIWDWTVVDCQWKQDTAYIIPARRAKSSFDIVRFYAATQLFQVSENSIDTSLVVKYAGPRQTIERCVRRER